MDKEMMEAWQKMAAPGKEHALLAKMAGNWEVAIKTWMEPGAPPSDGKGTATMKMILGGRTLIEEFKGDFGGMPFEGFGTIGFYNYRQKFWQTWTDNFGTGLWQANGTINKEGNAITFVGKSDRPAANLKDMEMKTIYRLLSDDHHIFETYDVDGKGTERKTMEIEYKRKR